MIKAIVFDCYGVFYVDPSIFWIQKAPADQREHLRYLRNRASLGQISEDDFLRAEAKAVGRPFKELHDSFFSGLMRHNDVLDYAESLRGNYKIGFLSNISRGTMDSFFTPSERRRYFDAVVLSSEEGIIKPQPEIFKLMCERLGVRPSEAVMVDDSEANCQGAREAGMAAIRYHDLDQLKHDLPGLLRP